MLGAWPAAMFHFMTHAFFKALLFLAAGALFRPCTTNRHVSHGRPAPRLPLAFWTFVIAGRLLSGLPLITAGFFSKDLIIWGAWSATPGATRRSGSPVWPARFSPRSIIPAHLPGLLRSGGYPVTKRPGYAMTIPLMLLAFFSVVGGYLKEAAAELFQFRPAAGHRGSHRRSDGGWLGGRRRDQCSAIGLYFAYLFHLQKRGLADALVANSAGRALHQWWFADWGFDWIYDKLVVHPFVWISQINRSDFVDSFYTGIARLADLAIPRTESLLKPVASAGTPPPWLEGRQSSWQWCSSYDSRLAARLLAGIFAGISPLEPPASAMDCAPRHRRRPRSDRWHLDRQVLKPRGRWLDEVNCNWVPGFGIRFHLAVDGLSLLMLMLTFFLGVVSVLVSWMEIRERVGFFHFNLLWVLTGIAGVFLAVDLFLFYFAWRK